MSRLLQYSLAIPSASSRYPGMPSSTVTARMEYPPRRDNMCSTCRSERESLPPDTATATSSPLRIMLWCDMVLAVFRTMDAEKHSPQRLSPEYLRV